ncbi:MAG: hypothetical protein J7K48_03235, partial [Thermococcus sp.]|nr:hypothetical protein [Thermococcus sp.]
MIALALGLIVGFGLAFLLGKVKGRKSEMATTLAVPLMVYEVAEGVYGGWSGNVFIATPLGDFTPRELVGLETFLALLVVLVCVHLRARGTFEIDEFIGFSTFFWAMVGFGIGLSASGWSLLAIPGLILWGILMWASRRNPLVGLRATPCTDGLSELVSESGLKCLTDEESLGVYRINGYLLVGGKIGNFPRWREIVRCIAMAPEQRTVQRVIIGLIYLLPVPAGIILGDGIVTALTLLILAVLNYLTVAFLSVRSFQRALPEDCKGVMNEYKKFFKESKKREGKRVIA